MGRTIKTEIIFRTISEIAEALSVTNIPKHLLDMALDTISRVLDVDGCWVQLITPSRNELSLSACCGFTSDMQHKMATMNLDHPLGKEVVGIGNTIIIPDLSRDGHFNLSLFEEAGFRSLIAVPILTYREHGIMGTAYRATKRFSKDDSDLLTAIASVIGMAFNKCVLLEQTNCSGKSHLSDKVRSSLSPPDNGERPKPEPFESGAIASSQKQKKGQDHENSETHEKHLRRMRVFRNSHKTRQGP